MGDVIVVFRIMPEHPDRFFEIKEGLEKLAPDKLEEEPIAFGLTAIKFTKIIPDAEGEILKLEEKLKAVKGVKGIETLMVSRSL